MKERYLTLDDIVYWIEPVTADCGMPISYKVEHGLYLGTYAIGSNIKHICTPAFTSCVVRQVDEIFFDEVRAAKALETLNESLESN